MHVFFPLSFRWTTLHRWSLCVLQECSTTLTSRYSANWMERASSMIHPLIATWAVSPFPWMLEREQEVLKPRQKNVQKKLIIYHYFLWIMKFPSPHLYSNIHVIHCETNSLRIRYLLLCFWYIFVPSACYRYLHTQHTVLSTERVHRVSCDSW